MSRITKTITLVTFDELDDKAKEKARDWWQRDDDFSFESEYITEDFKQQLKELGYPTDDIQWSLSHCQGDGVAFHGFADEGAVLKRLCMDQDPRIQAIDIGDIGIEIQDIMIGNYYHYNTMRVVVHGVEDEELEREIETAVLEEVREVSRDLENKGYESVDYYASDEYIDDHLINNGYTFTLRGEHMDADSIS